MNKSKITVVPFHNFVTGSFLSGATAVNVRPNDVGISATRLAVVADSYAHFRVRSLRFRLHPQTTITAAQAMGYVGGVQDTVPTTMSQIGELIPSSLLGVRATIPSSWVNVPKGDLVGPLPWYKAIPGGADTTEEQPGYISIAGTGTETFLFEIAGVFEFKVPISTANTPAEAELLRQLRAAKRERIELTERDTLLRILSPSKVKADLK